MRPHWQHLTSTGALSNQMTSTSQGSSLWRSVVQGSRVEEELSGSTLRGDLEPSNALIDKFAEIQDSGELRYIGWEDYIKKSPEFQGVKKFALWTEDFGRHMMRCYQDGVDIHVSVRDHMELKNAAEASCSNAPCKPPLFQGPRKTYQVIF